MKEGTTRVHLVDGNRPRIISDDFAHGNQQNTRQNNYFDEDEGPLGGESPAKEKKRRHRPRGCRGRGSRRNRSMRRAAAQAAASRQGIASSAHQSVQQHVPQTKLTKLTPYEATRGDINEKKEELSNTKQTKETKFTIVESNGFGSNNARHWAFETQTEKEAAIHAANSEVHHLSTTIDRRRHFLSKRDELGIMASSSVSGRSLGIVSSSSSSERSIMLTVSNSFEAIDGKDNLSDDVASKELSYPSKMGSTYQFAQYGTRVDNSVPRLCEETLQESSLCPTSVDTNLGVTSFKISKKVVGKSRPERSDLNKTRKHSSGGSGSLFSTSPKSFLRGEQKRLRTIERKEMDHILSELMGPREGSDFDVTQEQPAVFLETPKPYCWF